MYTVMLAVLSYHASAHICSVQLRRRAVGDSVAQLALKHGNRRDGAADDPRAVGGEPDGTPPSGNVSRNDARPPRDSPARLDSSVPDVPPSTRETDCHSSCVLHARLAIAPDPRVQDTTAVPLDTTVGCVTVTHAVPPSEALSFGTGGSPVTVQLKFIVPVASHPAKEPRIAQVAGGRARRTA